MGIEETEFSREQESDYEQICPDRNWSAAAPHPPPTMQVSVDKIALSWIEEAVNGVNGDEK
jgi:hypothetical protein